MPLSYYRRQCKKATLMSNSQFYMYFIISGKKSVAEIENFNLVCLALAALNNFRGDKIKISNKAVSKL